MSRFLRNRQFHLLFLVVWGMASLSGVDVSPDLHKIDPLLLAGGAPALAAAQAKVMEAGAAPAAAFPVFFRLRGASPDFAAKVEELGGGAKRITGQLYTGILPMDGARYVSNWPEVAYIEAARRAAPMLDESRPAIQANVVQSGTGLPAAYDGTGIDVGLVDTGLSSTHLDFYVNGNPSSPRVVRWYPDEATAGIDTEWHGTHVAGIAAGNGFLSGGRFIGMAPGASLVVAQTSFVVADIVNKVASILAFADNTGTPVAVNLSLGLSTGPHDGTSGFESALEALAADGVSGGGRQIIAVATGNEQGGQEHFRAVLPPFGSVTIPLSLEPAGSFVDIWADGDDLYSVTATLGQESASAPSGGSATSSNGNVAVSNRIDTPVNGATHIAVFFTASATASPASIRLTRTHNAGGGRVDAYIDGSQGVFTTAVDAGTITEPANAEDVIAVGAFNTKGSNGAAVAQDLSSFSSLGPTRDGRLKPDVTAPGEFLYSAKSDDPYLGAPPAPPTVPGFDNYVILAGTSMATPHVTGVAALVWQSNPLLTSAQMRARLTHTANAPTDGSAVPNNRWGYGKVNALEAVRDSVASITAPAVALPGSSVALTSENSSGAFGDPLTVYSWVLDPPAGSAASLSGAQSSSASFTPDIPGDYGVTLNVAQAVPANTPEGGSTAVVHVNAIPSAQVTGPTTDNVGTSVSFDGGESNDPDGQALTYRWVLVSRPTGSTASLSGGNAPDVSLTPDKAGTYEVGLRVDDGLDNSALAIRSLAATGTGTTSSSGGGGGCSTSATRADNRASSTVAALLLLFPLGALAARKRRAGGSRPARLPR